MTSGQILTVVLLVGVVGGGGYAAYQYHQKNAGTAKPDAGEPNPYAPTPYVPTEQLGIQPLAPGSPALAPTLAPTADATLAKMQAEWDAKQKQAVATLEAQYQADLSRQSAAREADILRLQRESQAREAEIMRRQEEELRRQHELVRQAEESRQRELETIRRQEEARKAAEEARRQDRLTQLNGQLRDVQDQIKLTETRLNALNASQPDAAWTRAITDQEWTNCRNESFGWVRCNDGNMQPRIQEAIKREWEKKLTADRVPLTDQLTMLRTREKGILADIASLGGTAGSYGYGTIDTRIQSTPQSLATKALLASYLTA